MVGVGKTSASLIPASMGFLFPSRTPAIHLVGLGAPTGPGRILSARFSDQDKERGHPRRVASTCRCAADVYGPDGGPILKTVVRMFSITDLVRPLLTHTTMRSSASMAADSPAMRDVSFHNCLPNDR